MSKKRKGVDAASALRGVPLLAGLNDKQLRIIERQAKEVTFSEGKVLCKEGEMGTGLHVILEGETKVQVRGRTRRRLGPGAFYGEIALLDGGPRTATVVAETDGRLLSIPVWNFKNLIKEYPTMALKMLEEVAARLRETDASIQK
ncbi:MAG: cyclic nucleotide-binding domain-containing protein [Actinobacteria bacterium]|nr:cyclic nucleotide-binding domain-containing protein [Actinomycetota bacterium]